MILLSTVMVLFGNTQCNSFDEDFDLVEYDSEVVLHKILFDGSQLWSLQIHIK